MQSPITNSNQTIDIADLLPAYSLLLWDTSAIGNETLIISGNLSLREKTRLRLQIVDECRSFLAQQSPHLITGPSAFIPSVLYELGCFERSLLAKIKDTTIVQNIHQKEDLGKLVSDYSSLLQEYQLIKTSLPIYQREISSMYDPYNPNKTHKELVGTAFSHAREQPCDRIAIITRDLEVVKMIEAKKLNARIAQNQDLASRITTLYLPRHEATKVFNIDAQTYFRLRARTSKNNLKLALKTSDS